MTLLARIRLMLKPPSRMTMAEFSAAADRIKAPRRDVIFAIRSAASKKGWQTRRMRAVIAAIEGGE